MQNERAAQIAKRLSQLKACRQEYESHWRECYQYFAPERQQGWFSSTEQLHSTRKSEQVQLYDNTGIDSVQLLQSSIISGTMPANALWFKAVPDGVDDPSSMTIGERWLDGVCDFLWRNIHGANFDSEMPDTVKDTIVAGWGVLFVDIDRGKGGGFVFQSWPIAECYLSSTRADGVVDSIYREFSMTASALHAEYGDAVGEDVMRCIYGNKADEQFNVVYCIEPRKGYKAPTDNRKQFPKDMPFAAYHVLSDKKILLRESGFTSFPCVVPRYEKMPRSVYGSGQASKALPEMKMLNKLKEQVIQWGELQIGGMWEAVDDGVLNPSTIKIGPRRIIVTANQGNLSRLDTGGNFQVADWMVNGAQAAIRKSLFADQLQPVDGPAMTATEVHIRVELIRQQIGPLYGRFQTEFMMPLLDRCFDLAMRAGVFGDAPPELQGRNLTFKFVSPLARAQQMQDVTAIERLIGNVGNIMQVDPNAIDNVDIDAAVQIIGDHLGVRSSVMRTAEQVTQIRQAKAEAQQQAAAAQQEAAFGDKLGGAVANGLEAQMTSGVRQ